MIQAEWGLKPPMNGWGRTFSLGLKPEAASNRHGAGNPKFGLRSLGPMPGRLPRPLGRGQDHKQTLTWTLVLMEQKVRREYGVTFLDEALFPVMLLLVPNVCANRAEILFTNCNRVVFSLPLESSRNERRLIDPV